ncbi:hypothetical protein SLE2022_032980 [Rubroshorea leprosula]
MDGVSNPGGGGGGGEGQGEAPNPNPSQNESQNQSQEQGERQDQEEEGKDDEELMTKAQSLMEKITSSPDNPNPAVLHALSSLLETQELLYIKENGYSLSSGRASHNIGRLGNLIRDNDEFFDLISSKFLSESRYSTSVQAAAARLLLSCSLTWIYPHVFEEPVVENIKAWVMDETAKFSSDDQKGKHEAGRKEASEAEMLKTYSIGLLAVCLAGGGPVLEYVLTSGLSAKLMRYLRIRVLGETSTSQRDACHSTEVKNVSSASFRGREEARGRVRQVLETSHLDDLKMVDNRSLDDQGVEWDKDRSISRQVREDDCWADIREPHDGAAEGIDRYDTHAESEDRWHGRDTRDGKLRFGELDESCRDDSPRCRTNRAGPRSRSKGRTTEGAMESEQGLTSPGSGSHLGGKAIRDRSLSKNLDVRNVPDAKRFAEKVNTEGLLVERDDNDECFRECRVGSRDISDLVRKAIRAAEAEAKAANAPAEAITAAGDAAAEVVKSAALEEFKTTNNEEAAVLAASKAASTVIDAADAIKVSRNSTSVDADPVNPSATATDINEDFEDYFIQDVESLAQLREKYCIQCLETLGEYVEVLGPVLHEKGVDVCLALLQLSARHEETLKVALLLPDVMKLICALAAHRKFAALFVDRGGMEKLLAVPRVPPNFFGLSSCLFTIGSLQGIMERVCALPSDIIHRVVELAIQLLECPQDQARKNAAVFFAAAFVFRAVLDAFDAQDGLQKLLSLLNGDALVGSGVNGALGLSAIASLRNDQSTAEILTILLTTSQKHIAFQTCVALRQYFRAHLLLLVDSIRPNKSTRGGARNVPSVRAAYKPLDISNEAMDAVFLQLQKDRKVGPAFVKTRWAAVEKFLSCKGHIIMLELCEGPPVERYLHDMLQYALGVLHIVTLVPTSRRMIVNATLSNNRAGIAVILDAANSATSLVEPEIIQPALNVLINLVCPPPSISNKPPPLGQSQQSDIKEQNGDASVLDRGSAAGAQSVSATPQTPVSATASGLVGDRRISLGAGAGCAGLAAQLEQGYRQAREAVRANNGIKVLLNLLQPRIYSPAAALDCLRALACRVLLGLARDDTIAHILTKLQVGKKLSELIRDSGSQAPGTEQGRWQSELAQVAFELIAIVTNSGRASTLAATDAATPTLKRIERAAIAAATPITYHSRDLLLLIHEHLQACGLAETAAKLLKEAQLTPLPSLAAPSSLAHQSSTQDTPLMQLQWPSGRITGGFLSNKQKGSASDEDSSLKCNSAPSLKRKPPFLSPLILQSRNQFQSHDSQPLSARKVSRDSPAPTSVSEIPSEHVQKNNLDVEFQCKTPIILPLKRKLSELKDTGSTLSGKRINTGDQALRSPVYSTLSASRRSHLLADAAGFSTPSPSLRDQHGRPTPSNLTIILEDNQCSSSHVGQMTPSSKPVLLNDPQPSGLERLTLDNIMVQYLKHQHRQCPAPITTLPPLSLLHPHACPEPKRSLDAPLNIAARLGTREFRGVYGGVHGNRRDRQFVYSRFRPWRTYRDDAGALLTCLNFLGDSSQVVVGSHAGELKIFDSNSNNVLESCVSHESPLTIVQPYISGERRLILSSGSKDVRLWDASSISGGPMHSFDGCKAAKLNNSGTTFATLSAESNRQEILLYDVQACNLELKLSDASANSTARGLVYSLIHFSPSDTMLLWNGVLWDPRVNGPVHHFEQLTDYGGGGFHPAGNEVIINSEVWDLRKRRLLRSVPSLDQTTITFNASGDVIYAILRRNLEDVMSAFHTRRMKHPLFDAFRTVDAINYSEIATTHVDRCVIDFATEPTDSFVGLITMDDQDEMVSSARIYEIGRRRPTGNDDDPDDAEETDEEEEEEDDDADLDPILGSDLNGEDDSSDGDDMSDEDDDSLSEMDDEDGELMMDDDGAGILEIVTDGDEDDDDDSELVESFSSGDAEEFVGNGFGF